jgi:EAL domain-containing protein (putative c-di-GMP-specific phosphodiesterase class I)
MRYADRYILPPVLGAISGTVFFLTWRATYSNTMEGVIFMICASACMVLLAFILLHYQSMVRKVLKLEAGKFKNAKTMVGQASHATQADTMPGMPQNQTDILDIEPLEVSVKKSPEESNLTNVFQLYTEEDRVANAANSKNNIIINLQAVIEMRKRSVYAYEVLARMDNRNGTYKSASEILETFKRKGQFHYLDKTILEQTAEVLDCLDENSDLVMQINISKQTLESKTAFTRYYALLKAHLSISDNLVLEIPQQQFFSLSSVSRERLFSITKLGFKLSIDNCLDYVALLNLVESRQINVIKTPITKFFEITNTVHKHKIEAFMRVCEANDVTFIVTHVDEGYQLQELIKYDVNYAQGFLFSAPKRPRPKSA